MSTEIDRLMRDFNRYTGDGMPGEPVGAALPIGDPRSGAFTPKKKDLRDWASAIAIAASSGGAAVVADATAAKNAAEAALDAFTDQYLGAKAADPTMDNDGNALITGALCFNTVANAMKVYNGAAWQVAYAPAVGGALIASNNLSDVANVATARANLGVVKGTADGNVVTVQSGGKLPALDGSNLTNVGGGGYTLLGTLTTTSGTTQTLSSLVLTGYVKLQIMVKDVGHADTGIARTLFINGVNTNASAKSPDTIYGVVDVFPVAGFMGSSLSKITGNSSIYFYITSGLSPSGTSISFTWDSSAAFSSGTIYVYGVK